MNEILIRLSNIQHQVETGGELKGEFRTNIKIPKDEKRNDSRRIR